MNLRQLAAGLALLAITLTPFTLATPASSANYSCINNDCPVKTAGIVYGGGPLITAPNVYVVRFSSSSSGLTPASGYLPQDFASSGPSLAGAINDVLDNPQTSWWKNAYSVPNYQLSAGTYVKTITLADPALATNSVLVQSSLTNAITDALANKTLPDTSPNAIYVVVLRSNQEVVPHSNQEVADYCTSWADAQAYNSADYVVNIPYFTLSDHNPSSCRFAPDLSDFDSETSNLSQQLFNAVLDVGSTTPSQAGWVNPSTGTELTNVCHSGKSTTALTTYQGQHYTIARLWSEQLHGCLTTSLTPDLSAAYVSPTEISVALTTQGLPLANRTIDIDAGSTVVAYGQTVANGTGHITIPAQPSGTVLNAVLLTASATPPVYGLLPASSPVTPAYAGALTVAAPSTVEAGRPYTITLSISPPAATPIEVTGPGLNTTVHLNAAGHGKFTLSSPLGTDTYSFASSLLAATKVVVHAIRPPSLQLKALSWREFRATLTGSGPIANAALSVAVVGGRTTTVRTDAKGQATVTVSAPGPSLGVTVHVHYAGTHTILPTSASLTLPKS